MIKLHGNLAKLSSNSGVDLEKKKQKLQKVCQQFESIFLSMIWKNMSKFDKNNMFYGGIGEEIFRDQLINSFSDISSQSEEVGLSKILYNQLSMKYNLDTDKINKSISKSISKIHIKSNVKMQSPFKKLQKYLKIISDKANKYGIDPNLVSSVILVESGGDNFAVSPKGAMGLMQIMPDTAKMLNIRNPFDPEENIDGGVKYLKQLRELYNDDIDLILAAYNAGPTNVEKYNGVPPFKETKNYINKVKKYFDVLKDMFKN